MRTVHLAHAALTDEGGDFVGAEDARSARRTGERERLVPRSRQAKTDAVRGILEVNPRHAASTGWDDRARAGYTTRTIFAPGVYVAHNLAG